MQKLHGCIMQYNIKTNSCSQHAVFIVVFNDKTKFLIALHVFKQIACTEVTTFMALGLNDFDLNAKCISQQLIFHLQLNKHSLL